ncbi:cuticle protein-like, partial [Tropilaelaps mercedesae]
MLFYGYLLAKYAMRLPKEKHAPQPYKFGYESQDEWGNAQSRHEEDLGDGVKTGTVDSAPAAAKIDKNPEVVKAAPIVTGAVAPVAASLVAAYARAVPAPILAARPKVSSYAASTPIVTAPFALDAK